jgi:hypothetical protein
MNQDIEEKLRRALRPVDPSDGFSARVMRALPERSAAGITPILHPVTMRPAPAGRWQRFATPAALAASLLMALLLGQQVALRQQHREQLAGENARRELMQALRVTSQKLDLAYQAVQQPAAPPAGSGEENRS